MNVFIANQDRSLPSVRFLAKKESGLEYAEYQFTPTKPNLPNHTYQTKITGQSSQPLGP